jgi:SAM-dependent methyltransferase
MPNTSWEKVHDWYDEIVGAEGHYYHQQVIFPRLIPLITQSKKAIKVLDVGCGQGILARAFSKKIAYVGIDSAPSLIAKAKKLSQHTFLVQDATEPFTLKEKDFTHAVLLLALQNMKDPIPVMENVSQHLTSDGQLFLVINHPCFRIPRQSGWSIDEKKQLQSRRIDRYMTPMEIPITAHPGQKESSNTISYHLPLSAYCDALDKAGFCIERIEEWCSDKRSVGKAARRENRARQEFPLFMCLIARKKRS